MYSIYLLQFFILLIKIISLHFKRNARRNTLYLHILYVYITILCHGTIKINFLFFLYRLQFWLRQDLVSQDYHIVNIILHSMLCLLTLFVYNIFLGPEGRSISFYAAALFAVHPIHTEAVIIIINASLALYILTWKLY